MLMSDYKINPLEPFKDIHFQYFVQASDIYKDPYPLKKLNLFPGEGERVTIVKTIPRRR